MEWTALTRIPLKARLYERETYFREGLADVADILCAREDDLLRRGALLMVKPDGLAHGKSREIIRFLDAHGLSIAAVAVQTLSRFHWRELWRYQLTCATLDRLTVNDLVLRADALLFLLRDSGECRIPASVRLSGLKGPSDVSAQPPGCLRRLLAQPNRIFSYFHVADEPADLLREIGLLLDQPARRNLLTSFARAALPKADERLLEDALAASARSSRIFDVETSLRRAEDALRLGHRVGQSVDVASEHARADLARMRRGERIAWRPFIQALAGAGADLNAWDLATLGASFIVYDEPGTSKVITGVDASLWERSNGDVTPASPPAVGGY